MSVLRDRIRETQVTLRSIGSAAGIRQTLLTPQQQSSLAERIRSREPTAEEELVRFFSGRVAFLVLARTHEPEMARDLSQEVMLAVLRALRTDQLRDPERLAGFVYGTARNLINNYLRSRSRQPPQDSIEAALHLASPVDPVQDGERSALVQRALRALNHTDRRILSLTFEKDLKPAEIGSRLGLSSDVVRARKSRALKKMIVRIKELSRG